MKPVLPRIYDNYDIRRPSFNLPLIKNDFAEQLISYCCIVDRDIKKSMQLDSIMFNSISNPIQKVIIIILILFS